MPLGDEPKARIVVQPYTVPQPDQISKAHPFSKQYQIRGPPPETTNPWDMYTPAPEKGKGKRKTILLEIDQVIDVPRFRNAMGKYIISGYSLQVSTMDGWEMSPPIGTFEPKINTSFDTSAKERFDVHQKVELGYYGQDLPALKVRFFRTDEEHKPLLEWGVTVLNPSDIRSLENHCYGIEHPARNSEELMGGIYIRLSGENVGLGHENSIDKSSYKTGTQKNWKGETRKKMKMPGEVLKHEKPQIPYAEVFLQRVMDMKKASFGESEKYLELLVHSGDETFSRCKIKVNKGIYCQRQQDGSIKWTWGDALPRTSWEQYTRTYYSKDPITGIVTKQGGDSEAFMCGPYYPEPDPVHPDDLESMILDETVFVPCAANQKGLSLLVKLGSMGFFGYTVIGVSEPIPIESVNFEIPCEYQFAKIFSVGDDEKKHIGTITLAAQLCMPWELNKTVPRVPYVEGFWSRDCVFGPYANESKPYLIGMDEYQERLEMRPPKFSRITFADRGTETREKIPIARLPLPESGMGMMELNHQVAPLIGPGGSDWRLPQNAPFEMLDVDGVDWGALKTVEQTQNADGSSGMKTKEQNPLYPNPKAVDLLGVQAEGVKSHAQIHQKQYWEPEPYQPWNRPTIKQIYENGFWDPVPDRGDVGTWGVPLAKDIEKYASDLVTKSGPLQGPTTKKGEGCAMA